MKEKNYLVKAGEFYLSNIEVSFDEIETDFMKNILFVAKGNGELSFPEKELAELFAKKLYINLGLQCEIVEDNDFYEDED